MKYYKQLDALRCYAVFWVVFVHLPLLTLNEPLSLFFGFIPGVQLFFCISGFLISGIVLDNTGTSVKQFFKSFYARRFLRIFPIYYATIFVLFLVNVENYRSTWLVYDFFYVSNIKLGLLGMWDYNVVTPHFWSLAVEEQFYLFWPGLLYFANTRWRGYALAAMLFGVGAFFAIFHETFFVLRTIANLTFLGSGCLLAVFVQRRPTDLLKNDKKWIDLLFWMSLLMVGAVCFFGLHTPPELNALISVLLIPIIVLKFIIGFNRAPLKAIMENSAVLYLGKISYGIYLYHLMAVYVLVIIQKLSGWQLPESFLWTNLIKSIVTILMSIASWEFFEKKLNRLKDKFKYH